jgi:hypothetical protein
MSTHEKPDTHQKALSINLDPKIFGSFAEIGAGQEVARWFLRVGGASGTVAKTISAYDKEVSDHLYGAGTRYVSKTRLQAMLNGEWKQLLEQLSASRGDNTNFFSFVDTVSARNYTGTNDCHGWVGLRFLRQPLDFPNEILLHVNLRDPANVQQQEAVGILGVNMIYAAYHVPVTAEEFLASLFENLEIRRVEIDCLEWSGVAFQNWQRDEIHAFLVAAGYAEAVIFPANSQPAPPNELLHKRALVLAPDRSEVMGERHADLIRNTLEQLPKEELKESKGGLGLFCLSIANSIAEGNEAVAKEIVRRVPVLNKLGYGVMVFQARELYAMSAYVNRYTKSRIHFAIRLAVLARVLEDSYEHLDGSLLEGVARLFTQNVRVIVYPMATDELQERVRAVGLTGWKWSEAGGIVSAENFHPSEPLDSLYQYLLRSEFILPGKSRRTGAPLGSHRSG